ncbi:MAG: DUF1003 domain-containing protein [Patescibacteria group bacterium]|nr:MAG: DUF1003 domain-containing protein [Patescibacteria group bacterium]
MPLKGVRRNKISRRRALKTAVKSIEAKARGRRSPMERLEDKIVSTFGTVEFLILNLLFFAAWIAINSGVIPTVKPFDPYPYILLITFVSLEAIILAIFVLITQNRQERISSLREETELQINLISEQELTKVLRILAVILKKMGVDVGRDPELKKMLEPLNPEEIERQLEEQMKG